MESHFGLHILGLLFITAVNAFFASAEVALLSSRQHRLRGMAEEGHLGAQAALSLLGNTERMLSVVQVGVTLASLAMGWLGEEAVYTRLMIIFQPAVTPATAVVFHGISFVFSFLVLTLVLVVVGEVVPKNLAIEGAERFAVLVAPLLLVFYRMAIPFVYVVEKSAAFFSGLLGLKSQAQVRGHSAEELKYMLRAGQLREFERAAIGRLLELGDYCVREIMVPRNSIVSLPVDADLEAVLRLVNEHQFSRFPVYERDPENLIGIVHTKDLLAVWGERRAAEARRRQSAPFDLRRLLRKPPVVPESKPLDQTMEQLRTSHTHMALIVDEFGTIVGLVTLEDLIEQVFGEIEDEYDPRRPAPARGSDELELDGGTNIRDMETQYGIELPGGAGFETLAGFLLFRLGAIPAGGESVEYEGRRYTVLAMERNRIARVRVQRLHPAAPGADTAPPG